MCPPYSYEVQRDVWDAGRTDVSLVRRPEASRRLSLRRRAQAEPVVMFHRAFRPLLELRELAAILRSHASAEAYQ